MELDEMKSLWRQYDEKLNNYNMINEKLILQMMKEKSQDRIGRMMNMEYLSLAVTSLTMLVFLLRIADISSARPEIMICYWISILLLGITTAWYIYKLSFLQKVDVGNQPVLEATERIQRFRYMIVKEKLWAFILMPILMAGMIAVLFQWIHNVNVFAHWKDYVLRLVLGYLAGAILTYWAYGKMYFRNIRQIMDSLHQIRELKEN